MIGWAVLATYVVGFLWTVRVVARRAADNIARRRLAKRVAAAARFGPEAYWTGYVATYYGPEMSGPLVTRAERVQALSLGLVIGTVWPFYWPVASAGMLFGLVADRVVTSPTELAEAERAEAEQLREQARRLGLPMPDADA